MPTDRRQRKSRLYRPRSTVIIGGEEVHSGDLDYQGPTWHELHDAWRLQIITWRSPVQLESANTFMRAHWREYQRHKALVGRSLVDALLLAGKHPWPEKPLEHAIIAITSYRAREFDMDNLVSKPWIDALQQVGIIRDDRVENAWSRVRQRKVKKSKHDRYTQVAVWAAVLEDKVFRIKGADPQPAH